VFSLSFPLNAQDQNVLVLYKITTMQQKEHKYKP